MNRFDARTSVALETFFHPTQARRLELTPMPRLYEEEKESPLWTGRNGSPDGPRHPQVSNELQDAIQNRNVVNVPRLEPFCDHVAFDYVLERFRRWKQYWAYQKGDWELFVKSQAQEAIDVVARSKSLSEAVRVVGSMKSTPSSTLGVYLYDIRTLLKQPSLQVQADTVLALVLLNPLREEKLNDLSNPDSSATASELHKALADVAKASSVAPRVEFKCQRLPISTRRCPRNCI